MEPDCLRESQSFCSDMRNLINEPHKKTWVWWGGRVLFFLYMASLIYFLFFSERYGRTLSNREYHYNLKLFKEIRRFWTYRKTLGWEPVVVNLAGNIGVFIPVGLAVPLLYEHCRSFFQVTLLSFEISLGAELIQLMAKVGTFDVDDLFLNTIGGCIGYALFAWCRHRWRGRK